MTITTQALRVYATLEGMKANSEEDVIDALLPFVMPVLGVMNEKVFDRPLFAKGLNALYGWNLTEAVAEVFEGRLRAKGFLVQPAEGARILLVKAPPEALLPANTEYNDELVGIADAFQAFSRGLNDLLYRERKNDELLDMLVKFLVTLDLSGEPQTRGGKVELPELLKGLAQDEVSLSADDRYLCARFVEANQGNSEVLPKLARLAAVGMLAELVQDFATPSLVAAQTNLTVILDAPVALAAVGVAPKHTQQDVKLTLDALRKLGCSVMALEESCDEMTRILDAILATERPNRHGRIHSAMIRQEVDEGYVRVVARAPDKALKAAGIELKMMSLAGYPSLHTHFTHKDFESFHAAITWNSGQPPAVRHDAVVMALVTRLRENHRATDLFESRYVFATINTRFVALAHDFLVARGLLKARYAAPVVKYSSLATAAWLKTGFGAAGDVPVAHLLAYCERVLSVKKEVVEKARELLRTYAPEKEEQFDLLLQDARSVTRMMDLTLGDEDALQHENISSVLEEMRRATAAELAAEYEEKLKQQSIRQGASTRALNAAIGQREAEVERLTLELAAQREIDLAKNRRLEGQYTLALEAVNREMDLIKAVSTGLILGVAGWLWINLAVIPLTPSLPWKQFDLGVLSAPLALGATYFSTMRLLQLPTLGFGNLLNQVGRYRLKRALERQGLVAHHVAENVVWEYGLVSLSPKEAAPELR